MAKHQQQRLDWIDQRNEQQVNWAINYLATRVRLPGGDPRTVFLEACKKPLTSPIEEARLLELMPKMRSSWRAQCRRLQIKDKRSYSFELSTEVGPALKRLSRASGVPAQQVLEKLILNADSFRADLAERKSAEIAKIKAARIPPHPKKQIDTIKAQKQIIKAWEEQLDALICSAARYWTVLGDNGLLDKKRMLSLSPAQELKASALEHRWKVALKRAIQENAKIPMMQAGGLDSPAF